VERLLLEKGTVTGVRYKKNGELLTAHAEREVILCGGTFDSPRLLLNAGIGPADHLKEIGIDVAVDLPGVGKNLIDHTLTPLPFRSKKPLPPPKFLAEAGIFLKTRSGMGAASPNLQVNVNATVPSLAPPNIGDSFQFVLVNCQPASKGFLKLRSNNPEDIPVINPNYMKCHADYETVRSGIEFARKVVTTRAMTELNNGCIPIKDDDSEQAIEGFIRNNSQTIWHPVGTCKMGLDSMAVVDPVTLKVYGVKNLRVIDASVMPTIPSGNTVAAVHMIGEKGSDMILKS